MLSKIRELIENLNKTIKYCHWKSNFALTQALSGKTDVDLLVDRKDADSFRTLMGKLCFRPAVANDVASFPSVEHYFALDEESGDLVHVHAYYRVITGESLVKNYRLPIEEMLLENTWDVEGIHLPAKSAELVIFTLRMMLKHTSVIELLMLARDWKHVKEEILWLLEGEPVDESINLIKYWLPAVDPRLFLECVQALRSPAPLLRRVSLGIKMRSSVRVYARRSMTKAWWDGMRKFLTMGIRRVIRSQRGMFPQSGGAVIAIVGPEATGKSTLLAEMRKWLGEHFAVQQIHAGKPKSTLLTFIPNLVVPTLRLFLPAYRSSRIETQHVSEESKQKLQKVYPIISAVRSVFLAYDRRALLARAFARASNGSIVLCDRYPSMSPGSPDGPQLSQFPIPKDKFPIQFRLSVIEKKIYEEIPSPDLVVLLTVPVEVAIIRNRNRGKEEPEDFVRLRHAQSSNLDFEKTHVFRINTDQPLDKTILDVKRAIWKAL
jgi:thymidylate kinase